MFFAFFALDNGIDIAVEILIQSTDLIQLDLGPILLDNSYLLLLVLNELISC